MTNKLHLTRKAIANANPRTVCVGYCDLQHLLSVAEPFAYASGVYGWNFDAYDIDGVTICTGYRGMPGRDANNAREYEERARRIFARKGWKYGTKLAKVRALLSEFAQQA